jgi:hypothetical protein
MEAYNPSHLEEKTKSYTDDLIDNRRMPAFELMLSSPRCI